MDAQRVRSLIRSFLFFSLAWIAMPGSSAASDILLTSFEPFGGNSANNSMRVMRELGKRLRELPVSVHECVLPVEYDRGAEIARSCARGKRLSFVLSLGEGACSLEFETRAQNLDDTWSPDNAGVRRTNHPIVPGGSEFRELSAPMDLLYQSAPRLGAVEINRSSDMGNYVCNNTAYWMSRSYPVGGKTRFGFIHVPPVDCTESDPKLLAAIIGDAIEAAMPELFFLPRR